MSFALITSASSLSSFNTRSGIEHNITHEHSQPEQTYQHVLFKEIFRSLNKTANIVAATKNDNDHSSCFSAISDDLLTDWIAERVADSLIKNTESNDIAHKANGFADN